MFYILFTCTEWTRHRTICRTVVCVSKCLSYKCVWQYTRYLSLCLFHTYSIRQIFLIMSLIFLHFFLSFLKLVLVLKNAKHYFGSNKCVYTEFMICTRCTYSNRVYPQFDRNVQKYGNICAESTMKAINSHAHSTHTNGPQKGVGPLNEQHTETAIFRMLVFIFLVLPPQKYIVIGVCLYLQVVLYVECSVRKWKLIEWKSIVYLLLSLTARERERERDAMLFRVNKIRIRDFSCIINIESPAHIRMWWMTFQGHTKRRM